MVQLAWLLTPLESGLLYIALGIFGSASIVGLGVVAGRRPGRRLRPMLTAGVVFLTLLLLAVAIRGGHIPLVRRYEVLIAAAWGLGVGALYVGRRGDLPVLVAAAAPTIALLILFSLLLVPTETGAPEAAGVGKLVHIVLAVLGFAAFSVAAAVGVLYLRQIRLMKRDPMAAVTRGVPSLERLDRINYLAAVLGFPLLAMSVLAGWLFLGSLNGRGAGWWLDPTVLVTVAGLAVYLVLLLSRTLFGWRGRRIALLSVLGFVVAVGGFVVATFCTSEGLLHR